MTISKKRKAARELRHLLHPKRPDPNPGPWKPGVSGNPAGRRPGPTFSSILREALTRKRRYVKPDGTEFESSELELIVNRAIKELRKNPDFDVKLLSALLDRFEGKVKEPIDVEGMKEVVNGLNPHDILMSRFTGLALARRDSTNHTDSDN